MRSSVICYISFQAEKVLLFSREGVKDCGESPIYNSDKVSCAFMLIGQQESDFTSDLFGRVK